jgi:lipopolysaccharide transport system ATP-binding protein
MSTAIKVENLSKIYRLGEIGTGTISRDLERWYKTKLLGKEDPFLKIGESNDRSKKGASDIVYSLKDINFEIQQGDAVGIIGRNGAGKSTLLKILSRVTTPTTGKINIKGRVASLLEVGTGFHPELTGRENIYLNGAILGMRKKEIDRKLEEIIDFSGVERYIDTPVKRYSSGMYVRLAFAVAAHLESEILIVDEVLAVGDAEFQKKCLGKMGEVSKGEGRTVLFVSHNMEALKKICNNSILLKNGNIHFYDKTNTILEIYRNYEYKNEINEFISSNCEISINNIVYLNQENRSINICVFGTISTEKKMFLEFRLSDENGIPLIFKSKGHLIKESDRKSFSCGQFKLEDVFTLPNGTIKGTYYLSIYITNPGIQEFVKLLNSIIIYYDGFMLPNNDIFEYKNGPGFLFIN